MGSAQRGRILQVLLWALGVLVVAVGTVLGMNAYDEELSAQAQALLVIAEPPAASERNAYVDRLGLGAPEGEHPYAAGLKVLAALRAQDQPGFTATPQWDTTLKGSLEIDKQVRTYAPGVMSFLELAEGKPDVTQLIAKHEVLLARHRAMREKPEYTELYYPARMESRSPAGLSKLNHLVLLAAAANANAGNLEGAVRELELDNAFHRKVLAGAATLPQKMIAVTLLQHHALLVSDLVRTKAEAAVPFLPQLEALVRPLSAAEADMAKVLRLDARLWASWLQEADVAAPSLSETGGRWWHGMVPLFYRPKETVNLYAAQSALRLKVAGVPAPHYGKAADEAMRQALALAPQGPTNYFVNPVGRGALDIFSDGEAFNVMPYIGRVHDTQGLCALVALQLKLRAAGAATPQAVVAALAGPLGAAHPDPYTGGRMGFDPKTNSLSIETQNKAGSDFQAMKKRYGGRVAIAL